MSATMVVLRDPFKGGERGDIPRSKLWW